jgi:hypothetical protein
MGIIEDGLDALGGLFTDSKGNTDYGNLISLGGAILGGTGVTKTNTPVTGYQGTVPKYDAVRARVPNTYDPTRRPGSGGQRYFTQTQYQPKSETPATPLTAEGLATLNAANPARQDRSTTALLQQGAANIDNTAIAADGGIPVVPTYGVEGDKVIEMAAGGIAQLKKGQYLNGASDGMADKVPARIDGMQEARLSDGEFVIPADVVSHLGNGNSDAGATVLKDMMARVRKERTGSKKQGKEINPNKFIPA